VLKQNQTSSQNSSSSQFQNPFFGDQKNEASAKGEKMKNMRASKQTQHSAAYDALCLQRHAC
jgi:hypothetical protein